MKYVQFHDLTEFSHSTLNEMYKGHIYYTGKVDITKPAPFDTEFAFCTSMCYTSGDWPVADLPSKAEMTKAGFRHIASMRNWYPSHLREEGRTMNVWWAKNPSPLDPGKIQVNRSSWSPDCTKKYKTIHGYLQETGCGVKLGSFPLSSKLWFRYLTILRLPTRNKLHRLHLQWLTNRHFRFIDEGFVSSFWVNGWAWDDYTFKKERKFWKKYDPSNKLIDKGVAGEQL